MPNGWPDLKITYVDTVNVWLSKFSKKIDDNIPGLLESLGKRIKYRFRKNIEQGQDAAGHRFPPLKRRRSKKHNQSMRPLYDTGEMFNRIDYRLTGPNTVEIGDPTSYGIYQSRGTKSIPQRAFISFEPAPSRDLPESEFVDFAAHLFYESDYYQGHGPSDVGGF
jgi:hypothetical protein